MEATKEAPRIAADSSRQDAAMIGASRPAGQGEPGQEANICRRLHTLKSRGVRVRRQIAQGEGCSTGSVPSVPTWLTDSRNNIDPREAALRLGFRFLCRLFRVFLPVSGHAGCRALPFGVLREADRPVWHGGGCPLPTLPAPGVAVLSGWFGFDLSSSLRQSVYAYEVKLTHPIQPSS